MIAPLLGLLFLAATGVLGVSLLRRLGSRLDPLERVAYGVPLGMVVTTLLLLPLATVFGLSEAVVLLLGCTSGLIAAVLWRTEHGRTDDPSAPSISVAGFRQRLRGLPAKIRGFGLLPTTVIALFTVRFLLYAATTFTSQGGDIYAGAIAIGSDWTVHLGLVNAFAYGENFPPDHPRFAGHPLAYHYLVDLTPAALVKLGVDPVSSLVVHSFVLSVFLALALYALGRRLTGDRTAATIALVLFLLGGGLTWTVTAARIASSGDPLGSLLDDPWNQEANFAAGYHWHNIYLAFIEPQRAYLYGLPLAALIVTLLLLAVRAADRRLFLLAGVVAGLLPLAHLPTMLALAITTPWLSLAFFRHWRRWILFHFAWVVVALPQLLIQLGGGSGALRALRPQLGWVAGAEPLASFWLRNLGLFLPLVVLAALLGIRRRDVFGTDVLRLLLAFLVVFIAANLLVFQPWDWDNHKVMVYSFLSASILAGVVLVWLWRRYRSLLVRAALLLGLATMLLSGVFQNLDYMLGHDRNRFLTEEQLELAAAVREGTPPRSIFVTGLENRHPIPVMSGRRVVLGFLGWMYTEGLPWEPRLRDVRQIFALASGSEELMRRYGVDYVAIGPDDVKNLGANLPAYRERYPVVISTRNYEVFAVSDGQSAANR